MKIPTLINSSSKINGELIFTTEVRIDGEVFGKVESDKSVIIGAEGCVKGFLRAKDLVVFGRLEGNIIVSGITVLHENASVFGNLYTRVFEVKDGAVITARVVTYDKLEALDEAQIHLAEEMIKLEPGRRQIHNYDSVQVPFKEPSEKADKVEVPVYISKVKEVNAPYSDDSGDILSKIMEHNGVVTNEAILHRKEENYFPEEPAISSLAAAELLPEASEILPETPELMPELAEEIMPEMAEMSLFELYMPEEDDDMFTLLSSEDDLNENQQHSEHLTIEAGSPSGSGKSSLLEFDFEEIQQDSPLYTDELISETNLKSVSIAECLGEPVKEDSLKMKKGKKKAFSSENIVIPQTVRKSKVYSLSGFEELRNLLIPVKYHDLKSAENSKFTEKKIDSEKHNSKKANDNDTGNKAKGSEKGDLFLNDAIRQLPVDDYSSLFN